MTAENEPGCLVCGRKDQRLVRDLCPAHYRSFGRKKADLPGGIARKAFDQWAVDNKLIAPKKKTGRPPVVSDPFEAGYLEILRITEPTDEKPLTNKKQLLVEKLLSKIQSVEAELKKANKPRKKTNGTT